MKLKFKHQKFQEDAAKAVYMVFEGQPNITSTYMIDRGYTVEEPKQEEQKTLAFVEEQKQQKERNASIGFKNHPIVPKLTDNIVLEHLQNIQRSNQIEPSKEICGHYNLTIEMETGVGKTYTYIKTMYELYKHYGWTKFIVVVPSIAIREGVYKSFQTTQEHFAEEYGKKIKFFIYNSKRLNDIEQFANDGGINVMIINSQAFNARGKDARRIYMKLDSFRSRRPIDVIAATNPILVIDEPQSVEGEKTKERLKDFNPLLTLRYSATHKKDSIYNMVYRLDAVEAYNKKLVKKISVKGVTVSGTTGTNGYIYLQNINLFKDKNPTATIEIDVMGKSGLRKQTMTVRQNTNLYDSSNHLDEYKNGYTISKIDGRDNSIEFVNGIKLFAGSVVGDVNEEQIRRLQIRETILSHLERERELYYKGIKVLSLFFIDEVAKYKQYDENNNPYNGIYADMFEEEYDKVFNSFQLRLGEEDYIKHIQKFSAKSTHAGYFSIDKKSKRIINSKEDRSEGGSTDTDAYDLIMKNKERLLDMNEPVRFIFSHSALREGWDNPNVFQICTLKQSNSGDRKRQEIGRGLRLCVNQDGERMDSSKLGEAVQDINVLTVVANESYSDFTKKLQEETAQVVADRPKVVDEKLFTNKVITDNNGVEQVIDIELAKDIIYEFTVNRYIDRHGALTDTYYEAKKSGSLIVPESLKGYEDSVINILDRIYDPNTNAPDNGFSAKKHLEIDKEKFNKKEFQQLWNKINRKSAYVVSFDTPELIQKSIDSINQKLFVTTLFTVVEQGSLNNIDSKTSLLEGTAFEKAKVSRGVVDFADYSVKYDLVGKIVEATELTRKSVVEILKGIDDSKFDMFKANPEDFILKVSNLINEEKATVIIQKITYNKLEEVYDTDIFTEPTLKPITNNNVIPSEKGLYNYVIYDSDNEKKFAQDLDSGREVSVYVKLPKGFYINTPVGHYNPDWAIAFNEGTVKHIYFVAETKGSMSSMQLKKIEESKIACAREHFNAISSDEVKYDVIDNYESLLNKVMN